MRGRRGVAAGAELQGFAAIAEREARPGARLQALDAELLPQVGPDARDAEIGVLGEVLGMTPVFWTMGVCLVVSGYLARKR